MPIDCTPDALVAAATCLECAIPPGLTGSIEIALLNEISGQNYTPDELAELGKCIQAKIPPGLEGAIIIGLLCEIANA